MEYDYYRMIFFITKWNDLFHVDIGLHIIKTTFISENCRFTGFVTNVDNDQAFKRIFVKLDVWRNINIIWKIILNFARIYGFCSEINILRVQQRIALAPAAVAHRYRFHLKYK